LDATPEIKYDSSTVAYSYTAAMRLKKYKEQSRPVGSGNSIRTAHVSIR
jgi:hypothetical protein